jgi:hypothetical protein
MDSPYYSESELCGGAVMVSSEVLPLASNALLTTLHPLLKNVLQTIDHFKISCLGAPFSWLEKPRNHMGQDLDCMMDILMGFHQSTFSNLNTELNSDFAPCNFWTFPTMKWSSKARNFKVINGLQPIFEKWVGHCKKCIACQGRYFEKKTITAPPQSSNSE